MVADKIGTEDIINIGMNGRLRVKLPDYATIESVKNLITRAKARYPRKDGMTYATHVDKKTNTITIAVVTHEEAKDRNKEIDYERTDKNRKR